MALEDYEHDSLRCTRCSYCKWVPWESARHPDFMQGCPSVSKYHFHAYAAGGKFNMALSLMKGRIDYSDALVDAVYKCHMDGSCDVSCKSVQDLEPLQCMQELRIRCVLEGRVPPVHKAVIDGLRKGNNMMQRTGADRGNWTSGLPVKDLTKEKAEVAFHVGCRYSFDKELWPVARGGLSLLLDAGIDVGTAGDGEVCCGGKAYELGYEDQLRFYAALNAKALKAGGVKKVVTPCAHCYQAFKVLYDQIDKKLDIEVFHITEYIHRLIKEGKIKLTREVPFTVTYHDPCHLGRLAEPWVHWKGREVKVLNQVIVHDPPKKFRRGTNGVYDIPRDILKSIPGLKVVEMYRTRESAWCCGAGGGVKDAYPDLAISTGVERLKEAKAVGAKAIVSACPSCKSHFVDTARDAGEKVEVFDIVELVQKAIQPVMRA
jgi:Fe-S oxidoreductase